MALYLKRLGIPLLLLALATGLAVGLGWLFNFNKEPQADNGLTYTVRRGSISAVVRTTGKLEPVRQVKLSFRASDALRRILVRPGDFVPAGTLLMELDTSQLERQLAQAQAQRDIARFNQSAQVEKAQNNPNQPPASASELYATARQSEQADAQLAAARSAMDNARLYAPFDGTVLTIEAGEGDNIGFGQPVATFADLTRLQVRAEVDEIDVANVATSQPVQFSLDAFPGKSFEGRVNLVSPSPVQRQGSTIYPTLINFARQPDLALRPGMAANLTITSLSRQNALLVPNRALETIGLRRYATRLLPGGGQEKVVVETGLANPEQTEIVNGLNENDRILLPR